MSDPADNGNGTAELYLSLSLEAALKKKPAVLATGNCLNCDEALSSGQRWCDSYCRDDWQAQHPGS